MAIINLTKSFQTIVDDDLFEWLNQFKWYASGLQHRPARRLSIYDDLKLIYIYHQIMDVYPWELKEKGKVIDHIDHDPLHNKRVNLRIISCCENMRNTERSLNRVGISIDRTHNRYKAYIDRYDLPRLNIGTFKTKEEAEIALAQYRCV